MTNLSFRSRGFWDKLSAFCQESEVPSSIVEAVSSVLSAVREGGDAAISAKVEEIDGIVLPSDRFGIPREEMKAASRRLSAADRAAIKESIRSVTEFHRHALPKPWQATNGHGATIGERFYPLQRVGLYIPTHLASTVVMTASLAKLAGVAEIVAFTPCDRQGRVSDACLAAMSMAGVTEAYRLGGPVAIAAMAYGTERIKPVVKVFGPGGPYTVEAKRQVYGRVGVDLLPGPSEVMIIVDSQANARFVAADLLAQAEHGSGREKVYLVSLDESKTREIKAELKSQLRSLSRRDAIDTVLKSGFASIRVGNYGEAAEVANFVAPEHLELEVDGRHFASLVRSIHTAGAIMQGEWTATALGDFVAGPSHELPTGRAGRFSSGLQVSDFFRRSSIVRYSKAALKKAAKTAQAFSRMEILEAHGRSVAIRLDKGEGLPGPSRGEGN